MTLARLSLAALLVCAAAEQPHHVEYHAMTVDSEGDVSNEKMKHLMRSHPDVLEEERAEILPSAADLAYKAMDLGFGTTGMALDDYPFACICTVEGKCDMDPAETTCKLRAGMNAARGVSLSAVLTFSCLWWLIW
ncbi:unnamed protein product [Cladocopium goreaui]|uniref:Chaperone protein DnaJ n=1 Tax=Cladocopium goreaui TaxID=2562237 RepID=A0A9P1FLQ8_9DINO|nr:unnamed protein product [Cladocopium goreaui]|mmetsp:Transcript_73287/g.148306  ORF Transcript_73287/g.148306 Transcript_73287/m.148306 type:complete len:135 (+) Transcript_73287:83-487(+)